MWPFPSFSFRIPWIFWNTRSRKFPRAVFACNRLACCFILVNAPGFRFSEFPFYLILHCCDRFPRSVIHQLAKHLSSFTWELGASSSLEFLLVLLAGFHAAMSFRWSENVIRFFADAELARTVEDKFIAVDFDFATILSSAFWFLHPLPWCSLSSWNS